MGTAQDDPSPAHGGMRGEMIMQMRTMVLEAFGGSLPHQLLSPPLLPFSLVWLLTRLVVLTSSVLQNASSLIFGQRIPRYETLS